MPVIQSDPDIRQDVFSLDEKLTIQQVRFVGARLRDLLVRYQEASRDERIRPIDWPEWSAFIDAAYSCGFVCSDASDHMGDRAQTSVSEFMLGLESDLSRVETLSLRDLRKILHYVMRSERWGDGGADTGGGTVWWLVTSRLGAAIANRLGA